MTRRWWMFVALLVVVAGGVAVFVATHRQTKSASDESAAPDVPLAVARFGTFVERVEAQGRVGPPAGSSAKLGFPQAGILQTVDVRVGQTVAAGQPLAELDRATLGAAVSAAQADVISSGVGAGGADAAVQSAAARLVVATQKLQTLQQGGPAALNTRIAAQSAARQAALKVEADNATLARDQELLSAGVLAGKDVDAARSQLASDEADQRAADARVAAAGTDFQSALRQAQADVAAARSDVQTARGQAAGAQARLRTARIAYANGVLTAPANGVVLAVLKHPGEAVDTTTPVIEVGPALGRSVTLSVPGDVARRITVGDAATLQLPATREGAQGQVTAVVPAVDPTTQIATVVVSGAPADAVPGDAVSATIAVGRIRSVLVPSSAIVQDPQSGNTVVFVRNEQAKAGAPNFSLRTVAVRASDASSAAIATGLRAGERVAAQGGYTLLAPSGG